MALSRVGSLKLQALHAFSDHAAIASKRTWSDLVRGQPGKERSCLIVGNAPGTKVVDCPFSQDFDVFIVNNGLESRIEGLQPPKYWVATDRMVFRRGGLGLFDLARKDNITALVPRTALVENGVRFFLSAGRDVAAFDGVRCQPLENNEKAVVHLASHQIVPILKTVTATAACIACILGYKRIALIGCDAYGQIIKGVDDRLHYYSGQARGFSMFDARRLSLAHRASYLVAAQFAAARGAQVVNYSSTTAVEEIPRGSGAWT